MTAQFKGFVPIKQGWVEAEANASADLTISNWNALHDGNGIIAGEHALDGSFAGSTSITPRGLQHGQ